MFNTFSQWIDSLRKRRLFKGYKSAILTIFLKPIQVHQLQLFYMNLIINHTGKNDLINTSDILNYFQEKILPGNEFVGTAIQEIIEGLEFRFPANKYKSEKKLIIFSKSGLHSYEIYMLNKMDKVLLDVVKICGTQLVNNEKEHTPFAFLENNGQFYR
ncbi:hypothetical protein Glove_168g264 [Diversispora epigaea]|uniref:Uncharacterized protein n=1 Tax=Diversispora epigaea TaxID=1348612 RepID=A0A397ITR1_9GLOM|nr:hypothetical protein Glove_168g264 [Diversispora epigaea]